MEWVSEWYSIGYQGDNQININIEVILGRRLMRYNQ